MSKSLRPSCSTGAVLVVPVILCVLLATFAFSVLCIAVLATDRVVANMAELRANQGRIVDDQARNRADTAALREWMRGCLSARDRPSELPRNGKTWLRDGKDALAHE